MRLLLVLRDQLDRSAALFDDVDPDTDVVVMTENDRDRGRFREHKQRLALGFAAMRHFRDELREQGLTVAYETASPPETDRDSYHAAEASPVADALREKIREHGADEVVLTEPGRIGLLKEIEAVCDEEGVEFTVYADRHFLCTHEDFESWADGRKELTLEYFYREQRREYDILLTDEGDPVGGEWNFDSDNRESFGADGPGMIPDGPRFDRDDVTGKVLETVRRDFSSAPGDLDTFRWPVTPEQAKTALDDFIKNRLPMFGTYQDAMWTGRAFLYHSRLSAALNLKLLSPLTAVRAAEEAYHDGHAPIHAVEGFIRQILGWREFVRGVYWLYAPEYGHKNALDAAMDLPDLYWSGETQMRCLSECVGQVKEHAYTHHIPRLMVIGLFGMMAGIDPAQMNDWHEAYYVDAWEWVSQPNMIGMALYADGGIVGTKPYAASGKYISRQSNYCSHCRFDPAASTGDDACPFTTFYWDFLNRHQETFSGNRRMNFQLANVRRKSDDELEAIAEQAEHYRERLDEGEL
ncbi:cryptochrome/photolyase family protein [Longibacter salinarum]|uniref:Cryptochrome/photolyase family protein n=1 Tax=Longibacter salinarum TaxID=1850348 RepID=A0A2A8CY74_9BACT|nr:cryptochrome/photolyase family protein [Longibacter salinarum]PEN13645.1 cryptochrome/photolyase family protein [Longibacter salinarum]